MPLLAFISVRAAARPWHRRLTPSLFALTISGSIPFAAIISVAPKTHRQRPSTYSLITAACEPNITSYSGDGKRAGRCSTLPKSRWGFCLEEDSGRTTRGLHSAFEVHPSAASIGCSQRRLRSALGTCFTLLANSMGFPAMNSSDRSFQQDHRVNRMFAVICFFLLLLPGTRKEAFAADPYPVRPIRFVVPFAPGGPTDTVARLIGQKNLASLSRPRCQSGRRS